MDLKIGEQSTEQQSVLVNATKKLQSSMDICNSIGQDLLQNVDRLNQVEI